MGKTKGYIKLFRDIQDNSLWTSSEPFDHRSAWIDLLLLANHKDNKIFSDGDMLEIKRGQFLTSSRKLAERWRWSRVKVERFMSVLESEQMVCRKRATRKATSGTLVTIVKYDTFQGADEEKKPQNEPQTRPHSRPHSDHNKNEEECTKNEKEIKRGVFTPPSLDQVREYCYERNNNIDPEQFIDFYSSKNWMIGKNKMKDWKAAVRTWERRNKEEHPQKTEEPQQLPKKYLKIFYDMEAQYIPPYFGFPEEWFEGDTLVGSRVIPLTRPEDREKGWYEPIEYPVKELLETYYARRDYWVEHNK